MQILKALNFVYVCVVRNLAFFFVFEDRPVPDEESVGKVVHDLAAHRHRKQKPQTADNNAKTPRYANNLRSRGETAVRSPRPGRSFTEAHWT